MSDETDVSEAVELDPIGASDTATFRASEASQLVADKAAEIAQEAAERSKGAEARAEAAALEAAEARRSLEEARLLAQTAQERAAAAARRSWELSDESTKRARAKASDLAQRALEIRRAAKRTEDMLHTAEEAVSACAGRLDAAQTQVEQAIEEQRRVSAVRDLAAQQAHTKTKALADAEADLQKLEQRAAEAQRAANQAAMAAEEEQRENEAKQTALAEKRAEIQALLEAEREAQAHILSGEQAAAEAQQEVDTHQATRESIVAEAEKAKTQAAEKSQAIARLTDATEVQAAAAEIAASANRIAELAKQGETLQEEEEEAGEALALAQKALSMATSGALKAETRRKKAEAELAALEAELERETPKTRVATAKAAELKLANEALELGEASVTALRLEVAPLQATVEKAAAGLAAATERKAAGEAGIAEAQQALEAARQGAREARVLADAAREEVDEARVAAESAATNLDGLAKETLTRERTAHAHEIAKQELSKEEESVAAEEQSALPEETPTPPQDDPALNDDSDVGSNTFTLTISTAEGVIGTHEFTEDMVAVGRDPSCEIQLESEIVSRRHAEIRRSESLFALVDLDTANGTFLNGKQIEGLTLLNDGDGIGVGKYRISFSAKTAAGAFAGLADQEVTGDSVDLGGMTLRITPESARRVGGDYDRIRGHVVLRGQGGTELRRLITETFQVGKDPTCDLIIKGWFAPRKALLICRGFDRYTLINISPSPKSVLVNGRAIADRVTLKDGATVEVYGQKFRFAMAKAEKAP